MKKKDPQLDVRLWKNQYTPGITFANSSYSTHSFPPHFHDHYVVMIVNKGLNEGVCEKTRYQVTPNDILFINPGEIHTGNSSCGKYLQYSALYVDVEFFTKHLPDAVCSPPVFTPLLKTDIQLVVAIKKLIDCTRSGSSQFEIEENKLHVFGDLIRYSVSKHGEAKKSISSAIVEKTKCFIKERYQEQFSLVSMTNYVGTSPFYLIRIFKQSVGLTPFQFLRNYRIEKAKQELLKNKAIAEVAVDVGFYDQSHFHKHFKLVTGVTPREYQRQ